MIRHFVEAVLALTLLIQSTCPAEDESGIKLPERDRFHLFLLAGQSNMAGRGTVEDQDRQPHPRVLMFTRDRHWQPAVDPLHFDKPRVVGVGLGRSFAIAVAEAYPEITIGLIPCAAGGSPIDSWQPGGYHDQTKSHPYDDALSRTRAALQDGVLKGILWHQGESDSRLGRDQVYEQKLHALIARFRDVFDAPRVPFIAGQMGQFAERPWDDAKRRVDAVHRTLPKKVPHTAFVSSDGLAHRGDEIHFDSASYRELGRRYAQAYLAESRK